MRVNVYAEEITYETDFVTKEVDGRRFYGIRMFLESPEKLHHTETDDDRSAITFWVPWKNGQNHHEIIPQLLHNLHFTTIRAQEDDERRKINGE